jgi:DNA-binding PadR family transcriptional regulator
MPRQQAPLSLEFIMLGFIRQNPIHGYDLYKKLTEFDAIAHVWSIKQSQVYALLDRLEEDGLIRSVIIPGDSHPNRKEYHITPAGEQNFAEWLRKPVNHSRDIRIEFLAKLFFALPVGPSAVVELLDVQEEICQGWLAQSEQSAEKSTSDSAYGKMVFDYRIGQIQATISWIQTTRSEIRSSSK